jgi:two-component system cell cycle sensor histidine kinase/response regulator CckA
LSEVGKGTTFNIYLPKFTAEPLPDQADSRDVPALGTETILLVDDENLVRDLGERILTKAGYRVLTARNGREALDIYKQHQPDIALVILDLIMPEMSGKECLRELVKIDPQVRAIVSSGHSDSEEPHEVPQEFVRASVRKPYLMRQLLEAVRKVLDA